MKKKCTLLPLVLIAATLCSAQSQSRSPQSHRVALPDARSTSPSEGNAAGVNVDSPASLAGFFDGPQGGEQAQSLVFKSVPGDRTGRIAEFTTPSGLRMRAYTNSPDSIRFTPVSQQPYVPDDIYIHGARIVETLFGARRTAGSGAPVGASVDSFKSVLREIANAVGGFSGKKLSGCSQTITITVDEDGKTTTSVVLKCTKG